MPFTSRALLSSVFGPFMILVSLSVFITLTIPYMCVHTKLLQLCPTLCNPMDYSLPGSFVHGILQARILSVGCHFLLQRIFPIQRSNPHLLCLLHWQACSLPLAPLGKPIPYMFSSIHAGKVASDSL